MSVTGDDSDTTTTARRRTSALALRRRFRALQAHPAVVSVLLLALFVLAHAAASWLLHAWAAGRPLPADTELVEGGLVALLCTPLVLILIRRFEHRARLALHALDIASDGFWVVDRRGRLLEVNQGYAEMSGYARSDLLRMRIDELEAHADGNAVGRGIEQVISRGHGRFDTQHRRRDGVVIDVNITAAWIAPLDCFAVFLRDDTARLAAERSVTDNARLLQRLLDSTAEGICGVDRRGHCTFVNRAALAMLGLEGRELGIIGTPVHELFHVDGAGLPARDACPLCRAHRAGEPLREDGQMLRRADGRLFPVACWSSPVVEHGQVCGAIDTFFDISDQVRDHALRQQSERRLEQTFELAPVGMAHIAESGDIVRANHALEAMLGAGVQGLVGRRWDEVVLPQGGPGGEAQAHVAQEQHLRRLDGALRWGSVSTALVPSSEGEPPYVVAIVEDIDERKRFEAERDALSRLQHAHQARTEFLSRMSHELRTPLNAVLGFSQLLAHDHEAALAPHQREHVGHIRKSGEHLLALVNDMLDLARIEAGHMSVATEAVDLAAVVRDVVGMLGNDAAARRVELRVLAAPQPPQPPMLPVSADRLRLVQVVLNIVSNAIKYNRPQGHVEIAWQRDGNRGQLRVTDSGRGMARDQLAHLFEPFNRLGAEGSGIEGQGIGLVVARRLVDLMAGTLSIHSEAGQGTDVRVSLPLADAAPSVVAVARPPGPEAAGDGARQLRVLYVEDDPVNAELLRHFARLRPALQWQEARTGTEALQQVRASMPDLVLLDMHLDDMNGLEFMQRLRALPAPAGQLPVVALSADALPDQQALAFASGIGGYLTKPVDFDALDALLTGALAREPQR